MWRFYKRTYQVLLILMTLSSIFSLDKEWNSVNKWDAESEFDALKGDFATVEDNRYSKDMKDCDLSTGMCSNNRHDIDNIFKSNSVKKKSKYNSAVASIFSSDESMQPQFLVSSTPKQHFHSALTKTCSCGLEHRLLDLGSKYVPRYISTAVCEAGNCWGTSLYCTPRFYKVRVLKRRDEDDEETNEFLGLPAIFRDSWVLDTISVNVACECRK